MLLCPTLPTHLPVLRRAPPNWGGPPSPRARVYFRKGWTELTDRLNLTGRSAKTPTNPPYALDRPTGSLFAFLFELFTPLVDLLGEVVKIAELSEVVDRR